MSFEIGSSEVTGVTVANTSSKKSISLDSSYVEYRYTNDGDVAFVFNKPRITLPPQTHKKIKDLQAHVGSNAAIRNYFASIYPKDSVQPAPAAPEVRPLNQWQVAANQVVAALNKAAELLVGGYVMQPVFKQPVQPEIKTAHQRWEEAAAAKRQLSSKWHDRFNTVMNAHARRLEEVQTDLGQTLSKQQIKATAAVKDQFVQLLLDRGVKFDAKSITVTGTDADSAHTKQFSIVVAGLAKAAGTFDSEKESGFTPALDSETVTRIHTALGGKPVVYPTPTPMSDAPFRPVVLTQKCVYDWEIPQAPVDHKVNPYQWLGGVQTPRPRTALTFAM